MFQAVALQDVLLYQNALHEMRIALFHLHQEQKARQQIYYLPFLDTLSLMQICKIKPESKFGVDNLPTSQEGYVRVLAGLGGIYSTEGSKSQYDEL